MADSSKRKWASSADWARHKQVIVDLYAERELEEVMEVMERDHDFYSTRKIYKTKIKEWDVGKRLNDDDVLVILHLKSQREGLQKQSEFMLMGKRVNEQNIRRYLKRKPQILAKFHRGHRGHTSNGRITCSTPPPPPDSVRRLAGPTLDVEIIFADCKDYFHASVDSGNWLLDPNGFCIGLRAGKRGTDTADTMTNKYFAAADLLRTADVSGAFRVLDLAFRTTGQLMELDVPKFLAVIVLVYARLDYRAQRDTLNILRKYVQGQASKLQHVNHRYQALLQNISALDADRYNDILPRLMDLMIALADEIYGPGNSLSVEIVFLRFTGYALLLPSEGQARQLKSYLDRISPETPRTAWIVRLERLYRQKRSQALRDEGRYEEALAELRAVDSTFRPSGDESDLSVHLHFIATVYRQQGDLPQAEKYMRMSLRKVMNIKGEPNADAMQFGSRKLAELLEMMGRNEEATNVREYCRNHIESVARQVEWDWHEFERRTAVEPVRIPSPDTSATLAASDTGSMED